MRRAASIFLIAIFTILLFANFVAPYSYSAQFRDAPDAPASRAHLLGTDALGRDRLSRLLYGARISMLFAPAAALLSVAAAMAIALLAGVVGSWWERGAMAAADLCLSLPWIFLLLAARAALPLNAGPVFVAVVTFGLLGLVGWAGPSRVMAASVRQYMKSDMVLLAGASGCSRFRLALVHLAPNLAPLALAQLLITTPTFLLAEANLGLLGLGIPEPLPSWGGLLRELESLPAVTANPWMLAPAVFLVLTVASFHLVVSADEYHL